MAKDYYSVLGVSHTSSLDDIKTAYRKLAKRYHPDLHPGDRNAEARFKEINEAYDVLSDAGRRRAYDAELSSRGNQRRADDGRGSYGGYNGGDPYGSSQGGPYGGSYGGNPYGDEGWGYDPGDYGNPYGPGSWGGGAQNGGPYGGGYSGGPYGGDPYGGGSGGPYGGGPRRGWNTGGWGQGPTYNRRYRRYNNTDYGFNRGPRYTPPQGGGCGCGTGCGTWIFILFILGLIAQCMGL